MYQAGKTLGQKQYIDRSGKKMIVFGVGPAGTGKTYLGMSMAIQAFKNGEVNRIILTRPAIEAGEKLGFLPGDLQSKIDPYLRPPVRRPVSDHGRRVPSAQRGKGTDRGGSPGIYEGPHPGQCLYHSDEAQNTTPAQMKMFLSGEKPGKSTRPGHRAGAPGGYVSL